MQGTTKIGRTISDAVFGAVEAELKKNPDVDEWELLYHSIVVFTASIMIAMAKDSVDEELFKKTMLRDIFHAATAEVADEEAIPHP